MFPYFLPSRTPDLRRWRLLKDIPTDLRLPGQFLLAVDLGGRLAPLVAALEQRGAHDDGVGAHDVLVVVGVRGAGRAEVAVGCVACLEGGVSGGEMALELCGGAEEGRGGEGRMGGGCTRVALVGVFAQLALCHFEVVFGDDLVEGVFAAADHFAGSAVAKVRKRTS